MNDDAPICPQADDDSVEDVTDELRTLFLLSALLKVAG